MFILNEQQLRKNVTRRQFPQCTEEKNVRYARLKRMFCLYSVQHEKEVLGQSHNNLNVTVTGLTISLTMLLTTFCTSWCNETTLVLMSFTRKMLI